MPWRLCIHLFSRTIYMKIIEFRLSDDVKVERKWRNCIVFPQVLYLLHLFPLTFYKRHREIMLFSCKASSRTYLDTRLHTHRHAGMFLKDMQRWKINYMTPTGPHRCNNREREELYINERPFMGPWVYVGTLLILCWALPFYFSNCQLP